MLIILIPFITQFYQVLLGREFAEGATSLMRLAPLLAIAFKMYLFILKNPYKIRKFEFIAISLIFIANVVPLYRGIQVTQAAMTIFFLQVILVPLFYFFIKACILLSRDKLYEVMFALGLSGFLLLGGTIVIVLLGLDVGTAAGTGELIKTRNVGDFNAVFPYLILIWPFLIAFAKSLNPLIFVSMIVLLIINVVLAFSRTAILFLPIIIAITVLLTYKKRSMVLVTIILIGLITWGIFKCIPAEQIQSIHSSWFHRFDIDYENPSLTAFLDAVSPNSEAYEIRSWLWSSGLELANQSPFLGNGLGAFEILSSTKHTGAHGFIIDVFFENGILGVAVLLLFFIIILYKWARRFTVTDISRRWLFLGIACLIIWFIVVNSLGGKLYIASINSFQVNVINGLLLTIYLQPMIIHRLTADVQA